MKKFIIIFVVVIVALYLIASYSAYNSAAKATDTPPANNTGPLPQIPQSVPKGNMTEVKTQPSDFANVTYTQANNSTPSISTGQTGSSSQL